MLIAINSSLARKISSVFQHASNSNVSEFNVQVGWKMGKFGLQHELELQAEWQHGDSPCLLWWFQTWGYVVICHHSSGCRCEILPLRKLPKASLMSTILLKVAQEILC